MRSLVTHEFIVRCWICPFGHVFIFRSARLGVLGFVTPGDRPCRGVCDAQREDQGHGKEASACPKWRHFPQINCRNAKLKPCVPHYAYVCVRQMTRVASFGRSKAVACHGNSCKPGVRAVPASPLRVARAYRALDCRLHCGCMHVVLRNS